MKILVTGSQGLAKSLAEVYSDHNVTLVSKSTGHDINKVHKWGKDFIDSDIVFNCAYDDYGQVKVLEFFFDHWKTLPNKQIISIGSRAITHKRIENTDEYWPYRIHKLALQNAHDSMLLGSVCDLKIINPGPIDTQMIAHLQCKKMPPMALAMRIKILAADPSIKRIDLWD